MKLNNYIIASLLSHLLLFSVLIVFYPEMKTRVTDPVFNIDIVGPIEEEEVVLQTIKKTPPKPFPYIRKSTPKSVLEEPPPKSIFGEGADLELQKSGDEEGTSNKQAFNDLDSLSHDSPSDKEGILPEGQKGFSLKPKSFLFDKETIEKYAQKKTAKGKNVTFDAPELHHRGYMRRLKDKIESTWRYPEGAARRRISGDLYITFSINRDGRLGEVKLIKTSGYRDLDEAAMEALKDAAPYWPLPDDWEGDELTIKGHFIYFLGGAYIM